MNKDDGYPVFSVKHRKWLMNLIEGLVSKPAAANFARIKHGNDLEIAVRVAIEDEHIFTPDFFEALEKLLHAITGLFPVIYLYNKPHPKAIKAINSVYENL